MLIDLKATETIVYTCRPGGARDAIYERRCQHCQVLLTHLGYQRVSFFIGAVTTPYWHGLRDGHAAIIGQARPPVLVLEDDIRMRAAATWLDTPAGCQVAYLGGSRSGTDIGARAAIAAGHKLRRRHKWSYEPVDKEWVRVFGIYNTHAILWLDPTVQSLVAAELSTWPRSVDSYLAENQHRWVCCLRRVPLFWQGDGHHDRDTWRYLD
jgi:hypothetical protein